VFANREVGLKFRILEPHAMMLEVPSGAVSDMMSRRTVLLVANLPRAAAFGLWTVAPSYLGFAVGFVGFTTPEWPMKIQSRLGTPNRQAVFMASYLRQEEKGTDVNLAQVHLTHRCHR